MDILHGHLEPIEAPGLWDLNFSHEPLSEVLKNNTVRSSEKGKHVLDEVLLTFIELVPVFQILTEINFLSGPEASHLILVHLPDVVVLDGQDHEAVWILLEQGLAFSLMSLRG